MTPDAVAQRLAALVGAGAVDSGEATADVPRDRWAAAAVAVRDDDELSAGFFDTLLGLDHEDHGLAVVLRLWSLPGRHAVVLRTRCPADDARVPSLAGVFAGAAWHEREVAEMLGIGFDGHPGLEPLLLPPGFTGHPLRKQFVLARRDPRQWPGAVEPGSDTPNPRRRPLGDPGRRR